MNSLLGRWRKTWERLGAASADSPLFQELIIRYEEPHRKYHTLQHLCECFERLDENWSSGEVSAEVELALWFHDAVYDVRRHDNELKSAEWAKTSARAAGLAESMAERVFGLILATRHTAAPHGLNEEILVDLDLSILGAPPARFDEYERQIREEYAWVPEGTFRQQRQRILMAFLQRPRIFSSRQCFERYEQQARDNITRTLNRLKI